MAIAFTVLLALRSASSAQRSQPQSDTLPLNTQAMVCRLFGVYVEQYATQREQGTPLTDALIQLRRWIAQAGHPPEMQKVHEDLLLTAYRETWLTPAKARQQYETTCVMLIQQKKR